MITLFKLTWVATGRRLVSADPHQRRGGFVGKQRALSGENVHRVPRVRGEAPPRIRLLSFLFFFYFLNQHPSSERGRLLVGPPCVYQLRGARSPGLCVDEHGLHKRFIEEAASRPGLSLGFSLLWGLTMPGGSPRAV